MYVFVVFKLIPRWFHTLPHFSIFFIWKLIWILWSSQGFFWFPKAKGWFENDKFDCFQQENMLTVLCQWFLPLITSFKLNATFCRFFSPQIWKSVTVIREHHFSLETRWGCYLMDCQAKSAWCICFVNNIINNCMKQKVSLDSICIVVIQNWKMSHSSIFNSLEII